MNIQIFGSSKSFDTKKAERYFKERGIKFQSIDLIKYGMSGGEFDSVLRAVGARSSDVFKIFFSEALIIAAINFVLSTAVVIAAIIATNTWMHNSGITITLLHYGIRKAYAIQHRGRDAARIGITFAATDHLFAVDQSANTLKMLP